MRLRIIFRMTQAGVDTPWRRDFPTVRPGFCRRVRWKVRPRGLRFPPLAAPSALPFPGVLPGCVLLSPQDGCHLPEGLRQRQIALGIVARLGRVDELLGEQPQPDGDRFRLPPGHRVAVAAEERDQLVLLETDGL